MSHFMSTFSVQRMSLVNSRNFVQVGIVAAIGALFFIFACYHECGSLEELTSSVVGHLAGKMERQFKQLIPFPLRNHIFPPSNEPYNFTRYSRCAPEALKSPDFQPSDSVKVLERILRTLSPGYFLECGANDGVFVSNTLWLERKLNWTGLLIEPDPNAFATLKNIRRKSWISNACVSKSTSSNNASFYLSKYSEASGLKRSKAYQATTEIVTECFPLYDFLQALDVSMVDFFSLDVEGNELDILRTVPFDKVKFMVLTVEYLFVPGKRQALKDFMASKGYIFFRSIVTKYVGDCVFLHPSVVIPEEDVKFIGYEDQDKPVAERP